MMTICRYLSSFREALTLGLALLFLTGCENIVEGQIDASSSTPPQIVTVNPLYSAASNWGDYVRNDGTSHFNASNTACDGSETAYHLACLHGAEKMQATVTGYQSCSGITITQTTDAYNWECIEQGDNLLVRSLGLKPNRRLADMINSDSWRSDAIQVYQDGRLIAESDLLQWYGNAVIAIDSLDNTQGLGPTPIPGVSAVDNGASGVAEWFVFDATTEGNIYTINSAKPLVGLKFSAPKTSLVVRQGFEFQAFITGNPNVSFLTNDIGTAASAKLIVGSTFQWIEGNFNLTNGGGLWGNAAARFATFRNINITATGSFSFAVSGSGHRFQNITSSFSTWAAPTTPVNGVVNNFVSMSAGELMNLGNTSSSNCTISKVMSMNSDNGIYFNGPITGCTYHGLTSVNNGGYLAFFSAASDLMTFSQVAAVNANYGGATGAIVVDGGTDTLFHDAYLYAAQTTALDLNAGSDNFSLKGKVVLNSNVSDCDVVGGLIGTNISGTGACVEADADLDITAGGPMNNTFVGLVSNGNDSRNTDILSNNLDGSNQIRTITDFFNFDYPERGWGRSVNPADILDQANLAVCPNDGIDDCALYDWRIRNIDSELRNFNGPTLATEAQACPSIVQGDETIDDFQTFTRIPGVANGVEVLADAIGNDDGVCETGEACFNRYLRAAFEIMEDAVGDEDGLCESNERCLYAPNIGYYQGHGPLISCQFDDGIAGPGGSTQIIDVEMYGYSINGY